MIPKKNLPRTPGRPSIGTDTDLREKILDAAALLFAEQGIAATSLRQIAEHAGATAAMVHYYFKSKDKLVDFLIEERFVPANSSLWETVSDEQSCRYIVEGLVERLIIVWMKSSWIPRLWLREFVNDDGLLRTRLLPHLPLGHIQFLVQHIKREQLNGMINPDLEPRLLFLSILGLAFLPMAQVDLWKQLFSLELTPDVLKRHILALLHNGLSTSSR